MITRLVLENWRSHQNTEFEFGKGTNVLVGAMGSGKSSTMDAISFALFGTFPNLYQKKVRLDDVILNKPERKGHAKIVLSFKVDGKEYTVKRELTRGQGQTSAEIRLGDRLIEAANKRVNEKIADILKINYDLFSRAVYAEQNNIDYFLEIPKGKRREKIDELLKIDRFESARKNLGTVVTRLVDIKNDKRNIVSSQQDTSGIPSLERELGTASRELEGKEASLHAKKKEKDGAEADYNEMLKKKSAFSEYDQKIKEGKGRADVLLEKIKEFGQVAISEGDLKKEIGKKTEERKQVKWQTELKAKKEAELASLNSLLEDYEKSLSEYDKKLQELRYDKDSPKKLKECRKRADGVERTLQEVVGNYKSIDNRLGEIGKSIEILRQGKEKCPICDSELDEVKTKRLLEVRLSEKRKFDGDKGGLEKKITELSELRQRLQKEIEEFQKAVSGLEEAEWFNKEKSRVLKEAAEKKGNREIIAKMLEGIKIGKTEEEIEKETKELEERLRYFMYKKEFEETSSEIDRVRKELERLGYKEELEKKAYDRVKELERDVAVFGQECKSLSDLIGEKKKRLDDLKKIRDEVEKTKKEMEHLDKTVDSFEILQKALQDVQGKLREDFTEETNIALSDVWKRLYPYADYVNLKLAVDDAGDYILQLQRRDRAWVNVEGVTSGGERSTACLALRIALSLVLTQNLSWLVLDEPTHNLDRRAIRELAVTLREHLPKIVDQVFVITHEEELESAASGYLYRLDRNKEEDEPTKIVEEH